MKTYHLSETARIKDMSVIKKIYARMIAVACSGKGRKDLIPSIRGTYNC